MEIIKGLSVLSVVTAAAFLIIPKGTGTDSFKYAVGIFTLAAVLSFFAELPDNFNLPAITTASVTSNKARDIDIATTQYLIETLLNKAGIKFKEITVITDKSDDSGIFITKARVKLINEGQFDLAAEIIKNQTGIILVGG